MKKIIFITGAVRSGKSRFAVKLAKKSGQRVVFIATCRPGNEEMDKRISRHRKERPLDWETVEEHIDLASVIKKFRKNQLVIIDCITLWISNLLLSGQKSGFISGIIRQFLAALRETPASVIIVSNEIGWGIVPDNKLSRDFRDLIGAVHQKIAKSGDEIYLMVSGIPLKIK